MTRTLALPLISALVLASFGLNAQDRVCGTAQVNNEAMLLHPQKAAMAEQLNREAQEYALTNAGERSVVRVIPVVFHIIHNNGNENISKEQVLDAMRIINEDFRGQNSDLSIIVDAFTGITADSEIEFRLAKKDPNGNCTDGITRTQSALTFSAGENVKDLISWNTARYLNIWVVQTIQSGAGGYAYYPGNAPSQDNEGIVVRNSQCGSIGTSSGGNFAARTLTHEIGHYMNLRHVWGDSNENAVAGNCSDDDNVSDTPNTIGSDQSCILNQNTCGSLDNVQNYMDYSTCGRMFTNGQKARMQSALQSSAGLRNNLWTANNLNNTGTTNGFSAPCTPNVEFTASNTLGCTGLEVQFTDRSWGADEDATWAWNWSFPGGTPATSNQQNPTVTYAQAGTHTVTLTITTGEGSDTDTQANLINVGSLGDGQAAPLFEGMETAGFPTNANPSLSWRIEAGSNSTWTRNTGASTTGDASVRINNRAIDAGTLNSLISPAIDLSNLSEANARLTFKVAHAPRSTGNNTERLRIYVSVDCGETWSVRYTRTGTGLSTVSSTVTGTFIPNANQWRAEDVNLGSVAGNAHVLLKFEAQSDEQNYIYLDDINIGENPSGIAESSSVSGLSIVPNPISADAMLLMDAAMASDVQLVMTDALGRIMGQRQISVAVGTTSIPLHTVATIEVPGIYFVSAISGAHRHTVKVVHLQ